MGPEKGRFSPYLREKGYPFFTYAYNDWVDFFPEFQLSSNVKKYLI